MKKITALLAALALNGCAFTQITIKSPESEPGPTVSQISIDTDIGYKGNAGSDGSTSEAGGAAVDVSGTGL